MSPFSLFYSTNTSFRIVWKVIADFLHQGSFFCSSTNLDSWNTGRHVSIFCVLFTRPFSVKVDWKSHSRNKLCKVPSSALQQILIVGIQGDMSAFSVCSSPDHSQSRWIGSLIAGINCVRFLLLLFNKS